MLKFNVLLSLIVCGLLFCILTIVFEIWQHYIKLSELEKNRKLNDLLDALDFNQVVIFVKSVSRAAELNKLLVECNFPSICIHSGMSQEERFAYLPLSVLCCDNYWFVSFYLLLFWVSFFCYALYVFMPFLPLLKTPLLFVIPYYSSAVFFRYLYPFNCFISIGSLVCSLYVSWGSETCGGLVTNSSMSFSVLKVCYSVYYYYTVYNQWFHWEYVGYHCFSLLLYLLSWMGDSLSAFRLRLCLL